MWLNDCLNCHKPFVSKQRLAYCSNECWQGKTVYLCQSDCALAGVDTPAIITHNQTPMCALCAATYLYTPATDALSVVLTNQLMHSLTVNYLVNNLDN